MIHRNKRSRSRKGITAVEILFIFATFVIGAIAMFNVGRQVIEVYFQDGNQVTTSPLI